MFHICVSNNNTELGHFLCAVAIHLLHTKNCGIFFLQRFTTAYLNEPGQIPYTCLIPHSHYCDLTTDRSKKLCYTEWTSWWPDICSCDNCSRLSFVKCIGLGFRLQFGFRLGLRLRLGLGIILGPGLVQHTWGWSKCLATGQDIGQHGWSVNGVWQCTLFQLSDIEPHIDRALPFIARVPSWISYFFLISVGGAPQPVCLPRTCSQ